MSAPAKEKVPTYFFKSAVVISLTALDLLNLIGAGIAGSKLNKEARYRAGFLKEELI